MNKEEYITYLLRNIPRSKLVSGGREVNCRCFYCPDSKDISSGHFYISIPSSNKELSLYHCFKCNTSGVVTYKTLIEWGIYDENMAQDLLNHNKEAGISGKNNKYLNNTIYNISNNTTTINNASKIKLTYINDRLGVNLSYDDLRSLKICLNLKDLLNDNRITRLTRDEQIVDQLDINFLGFISIDNAFLNMRRICGEGCVYKSIDKRYINYKIFDKYDTSQRFYTIPTNIDLNQPNPIKIHIAEGPFDILSVYLNLRNREEGIYTSISGNNFIGIILYFLTMYRLPLTEFHIYPDNDKYGSNGKIDKIKKLLMPLLCSLYIHRNQFPGEKDFGVSKDNIRETIERLI